MDGPVNEENLKTEEIKDKQKKKEKRHSRSQSATVKRDSPDEKLRVSPGREMSNTSPRTTEDKPSPLFKTVNEIEKAKTFDENDVHENNKWDILESSQELEKSGKVKYEQNGKVNLQKELDDLKLTGHLHKWTNYVTGWKRRYFMLEGGNFCYSNREKHITTKFHRIDLSNVVLLKQRGKRSCRFAVDTGSQVVQIRAKNPQQRDLWLDKLSRTHDLLSIIREGNPSNDTTTTGPSESNQPNLETALLPTDTTTGDTTKNASLLDVASIENQFNQMKSLISSMTKTKQDCENIVQSYSSSSKKKSSKSTTTNNDSSSSKPKKDRRKDRSKVLKEVCELMNDMINNANSLVSIYQQSTSSLLEYSKNIQGNKSSNDMVPTLKVIKTASRKTLVSPQDSEDDDDDDDDDEIDGSDKTSEYFDAEDTWEQSPASSDSEEKAFFDFSPSDVLSKKSNLSKLSDAILLANNASKSKITTSNDVQNNNDDEDDDVKKNSVLRKTMSDTSLITVGSSPTKPRTILTKTNGGSIVARLASSSSRKPKGSDLVTLEHVISQIPPDFKPRECLPHNKDFASRISLMQILKDAIGKDLSRISIPVVFSEPLSLLQRLAEEVEYADLLNKAVTIQDSCLRLAYVAAFAVSSYSSTPGRLTKPFNPILGETFEFINTEKKYRLLTEQVSHHPPVCACITEGRGWTMWGHACVKLKFWGKTMEICPTGTIHIAFPEFNDKFVWNKVTTVINNVLFGNKWIDHYGEMVLLNQGTGDKCKISFTKAGWFSGNTSKVEGYVYDSNNHQRFKIEGTWTDSLTATPVKDGKLDVNNQFEIWKKVPMPDIADKQYNFTSFAMQLNELPQHLVPYLPITDCRFRPDQKFFEMSDIERAQETKEELEHRQRMARKRLEESGQTYSPRWFKQDSETYTYKGGYWEHREQKSWEDLPDLFGLLEKNESSTDQTITTNTTTTTTTTTTTNTTITTTPTTSPGTVSTTKEVDNNNGNNNTLTVVASQPQSSSPRNKLNSTASNPASNNTSESKNGNGDSSK
eukprot:TRINITY_DN1367_c1_g3_i1.p1 TRINITY_DN1367_c1_g3~~TRINITY_DN1367_c1_g3_i1.p1  ORF type:complete len:1035 (+),score=320.38 TRINITY_DN1367_c1_g3_i1:20-3124(+)